MLVLSRETGQRIILWAGNERVTITLVSVDRGRVRLGFDAPKSIEILREELVREDSHRVDDLHQP